MLAVYVSGHGFGHATRTAEVLRVVRARAPGLPVVVCSTAPASLFEGVVAPPLEVRRVAGDVGLAQKDALVIDEEGSVRAWRALVADWDAKVAAEARWLRASGARLVVGDIPPLAFEAAAAAGLPSIGVSNFSWDWIYGQLARRVPELGPAAEWAAAGYRHAERLLRLPFAGECAAFRAIEDVPLVARRPRVERAEARRLLGLDGRPALLVSFGGVGIPGLRPDAFGRLAGWQVLLTGPLGDGLPPANTRRLEGATLQRAGLRYEDLVAAADVVLTKPGYGIVSDCIAARTRLVYTERGDFAEYPVMVAEMPRYLPALHVANDAVREGRLADALAAVVALPFPEPPRLDGADVVASRLLNAAAWKGDPCP
jgi:L-arabinokinase